MNRIKILLTLLALFHCRPAQANAALSCLPNEDQMAKLVAAAWKVPPSSIDVTLIKELTKPPTSVDAIRRSVEKAFDMSEDGAVYRKDNPADIEKRNAEIEQNVQRIVREQQSPRVLMKWVRIAGHRQRVDQVIAKPGMELGPDTPFERTYVNSGDRAKGDFTHFDYDHPAKIATIFESRSMWSRSDVRTLAGLPLSTSILLQAFLGKRQESQTGLVSFSPDSEKMHKGTTGDLEKVGICISPEENGPVLKDRVEIRVPKESSDSTFVMIVDRDDYSRVYRFEAYNPETANRVFLRESSNFDSQGFPRSTTTVQYDEKGKLKRKENIAISKVKLNPPLSEDLYTFRVPPGYAMVDRRLEQPLVIQPTPPDIIEPSLSENQDIGAEASVEPNGATTDIQSFNSVPEASPPPAKSHVPATTRQTETQLTKSSFFVGIVVVILLTVLAVTYLSIAIIRKA